MDRIDIHIEVPAIELKDLTLKSWSKVSEASRLCLRSESEIMVTEAIEKVQIVVDDRERPSGVVAELEKLGEVVVKIEHLAVGDYCIDGAVGASTQHSLGSYLKIQETFDGIDPTPGRGRLAFFLRCSGTSLLTAAAPEKRFESYKLHRIGR
jgi:hypothetical protein